MTDRRLHSRHPIPGEQPGEVTIIEPVRVIEIGHGGASVEVTAALMPECLHDFRLLLSDRPVVVKGRIAHCRVQDVEDERVIYRAGIAFVATTPHAQGAIDAYIAQLEASRRR